jgi:hypothetical protein
MNAKHEIKGEWREAPDGRVFEVKAIDSSTGRIVTKASCTVSADVGADMAFYFGREGLEEVERSVRDVCANLAGRVGKG